MVSQWFFDVFRYKINHHVYTFETLRSDNLILCVRSMWYATRDHGNIHWLELFTKNVDLG